MNTMILASVLLLLILTPSLAVAMEPAPAPQEQKEISPQDQSNAFWDAIIDALAKAKIQQELLQRCQTQRCIDT
jgi:hypothetical protein